MRETKRRRRWRQGRRAARPGEDNRQTNGLDRRSFLRTAGLGVAAASIAGSGCRPQDETSPPVNPATAQETWIEPWVWRPDVFPEQWLQLNIVEHQSPSVVVGFGNPAAALFTYNGAIPGPTVRIQGDGTLRLRLVNHLGLNAGSSPIGPAPDLAAYVTRRSQYPPGVKVVEDWCLGEHTNGVHSAHTTNFHTHGLHVSPQGPDPKGNGPFSDNIFKRLIPNADYERRLNDGGCDVFGSGCVLPGENGCLQLEDEILGGQGEWEFRIGRNAGPSVPTHPPGTHWYHPHPHGSTHNEVSSGMAGFLIVEGDVDVALSQALADVPDPDPTIKTGTYDYRERLMLVQRINPGIASSDPDARAKRLQSPHVPAVNGNPVAPTITMSPGAIERWRLLNGSVDGKGYMRFMVLEGQWVHEVPPDCRSKQNARDLQQLIDCTAQLLRVDDDGVRHVPTTEEIENAKVDLYHLAMDGVTLVEETGDGPRYTIRPLANPAAAPYPLRQDFSNLGLCYERADNLRHCYAGNNELYMALANRADFLFQAPVQPAATPRVYTILAKATAIHTENLQRVFQVAERDLEWARRANNFGFPTDTVIAYIVVNNDDTPESTQGARRDISELLPQLIDALPEVPRELHPPTPANIAVDPAATAAGGPYRTRRITYSGWGAATWPLLHPDDLAKFDPLGPEPGPISSVYLYDSDVDGAGLGEIVLPPVLKTMAIDGRKFDPDDPIHPQMHEGTAEEWVVYNNSISLFGEYDDGWNLSGSDTTQASIRNYRRDHTVGYPVTRAEAGERDWFISTRGIDHPFHIHINPFWLMRIDVPDENGNLVNILPEPRWQDTVWVPRNGGRVVFRSRFPDFHGKFVEHCHILLHEDNGMMQMVEIVDGDTEANFVARSAVISPDMTSEQVSEIYPPNNPAEAYAQCTRFIDPNTDPDRGQEYPARNGVFEPPPPLASDE